MVKSRIAGAFELSEGGQESELLLRASYGLTVLLKRLGIVVTTYPRSVTPWSIDYETAELLARTQSWAEDQAGQPWNHNQPVVSHYIAGATGALR